MTTDFHPSFEELPTYVSLAGLARLCGVDARTAARRMQAGLIKPDGQLETLPLFKIQRLPAIIPLLKPQKLLAHAPLQVVCPDCIHQPVVPQPAVWSNMDTPT